MSKFKVGDVVKLKSGGPKMTVTLAGGVGLLKHFGAMKAVEVSYSDKGEFYVRNFDEDALVNAVGEVHNQLVLPDGRVEDLYGVFKGSNESCVIQTPSGVEINPGDTIRIKGVDTPLKVASMDWFSLNPSIDFVEGSTVKRMVLSRAACTSRHTVFEVVQVESVEKSPDK